MEDADPDNTQFLGGFMKKWADRYSFKGEFKNGNTTIFPDYHFIVTSQYHPNECFKRARDAEAIMRRFDVYHVTAISVTSSAGVSYAYGFVTSASVATGGTIDSNYDCLS